MTSNSKSYVRALRLLMPIVLIFEFAGACKPRDKQSKLSATSSERSGACQNTITSQEEANLFKAASAATTALVQGKLSTVQHEAKIDSLLSSYLQTANKGHAKSVVANAHSIVGGAQVLPVAIALALDSNFEPPPSFFALLTKIGVPIGYGWPYLKDVSNHIRESVQTLAAKNVVFSVSAGWNFNAATLTIDELQTNAKLRSAFLQLFAPDFYSKLAAIDRSESIRTEKNVFLPPDKNGVVKVLTEEAWNIAVSEKLKTLTRETNEFISHAKDAATYWNLMSGRLIEIFGGERGHKGKTAPEIAAEGSYRSMLSTLNNLRMVLGVGGKLRPTIIDMLKTANEIESKQLEAGIAKLDSARKAAIAAPFVPILIWAAPYAGGLVGPSFAAAAGTTSAVVTATPFIFATGSVIHAAIDTSEIGGSFSCSVYEQFTESASRALIQAPFLAALPSVTALSAAGGAAVSGGAVLAETAYGVINITMATYSAAAGIKSGIGGIQTCFDLLHSAEDAGRQGNENLVNAKAADAYKACTQAGLDLGQSLVQAGNLTQSAYTAFKNRPVPLLVDADLAKPPKYTAADLEQKIGPYKELSQAEIDAVVAYAGPSYMNINSALRDGQVPHGVDAMHVTNIDNAMKKINPIPSDVVVFRGRPRPKNIDQVGSIITLASYTSASIDPHVALNFSGEKGLILEIRAAPKKSLPGIFVPLLENAPFKDEAELLLPRGTKFKVLSSNEIEVDVHDGNPPFKILKQILEVVQ